MGGEFTRFSPTMEDLCEESTADRNHMAGVFCLLQVSVDFRYINRSAKKECAPDEQVAHLFEVFTLAASVTQFGNLGRDLIPVSAGTPVSVLGNPVDEGPVREFLGSFPGIDKSSREAEYLRPLAFVDRRRRELNEFIEHSQSVVPSMLKLQGVPEVPAGRETKRMIRVENLPEKPEPVVDGNVDRLS